MSTKDIDDGLTDAERAALAEDDGSGDAPEAVDPELEAGQGADDDNKAGEEAAAAAAADPAATAAADEQSNPAATEPDDAEAKQQPAPLLVAPPPEDAQAKLTEIEGKKDDLLEQFDNGDITAKEYQKQLDALAKEERAIERAQDRAELAASMENQRLQNEWVSTCNAFVEANEIYKDNPRLYKALDNEVRELAADPKTANWTGQKFLQEAHKNLKAAFNLPDSASPNAPIPPNRPKPDLPPNLARVPAADVQDTNGGRFAVLDRLANTDPIAYEETLNKMPAAERDAYLAAG